jgi:hypothetical protein
MLLIIPFTLYLKKKLDGMSKYEEKEEVLDRLDKSPNKNLKD